MASGWTNDDVQTQERRNREWLARFVLGLPFPDVDDALVPQVLPRAASFALTSTETNHATFPPASVVVVHKITITSTADVALSAWVALYAGTFAYSDIVARSATVQPREVLTFDGPWFCAGSTTVRSGANAAAGQLAGRIDYTVLSQATPGITPVFGRVALTGTPTAWYTTPAGVHSAYVASLGQCGLGTVDYGNAVTIELLPSGQASAAQFYLVSAPVLAAETEIVGGFTLQPGDAIRAWRSSGSESQNFAFNVVEFRG